MENLSAHPEMNSRRREEYYLLTPLWHSLAHATASDLETSFSAARPATLPDGKWIEPWYENWLAAFQAGCGPYDAAALADLRQLIYQFFLICHNSVKISFGKTLYVSRCWESKSAETAEQNGLSI